MNPLRLKGVREIGCRRAFPSKSQWRSAQRPGSDSEMAAIPSHCARRFPPGEASRRQERRSRAAMTTRAESLVTPARESATPIFAPSEKSPLRASLTQKSAAAPQSRASKTSWLVPEDMWEYIGRNPIADAAANAKIESPDASQKTAKKRSSATAPETAERRRGAR